MPGKIPVGYKTTWVVNPYDTVTIYTQGKHNYKIGTFYWLGLVTNGEHLHYELWNKKKRYSSVIAAKAIKLIPVYND
ncbi:MAG: hypothetical protein WCG87_03005 [Bacteroidota bacterium]